MKSGFFEKKRMTMCVVAAVVMLVSLSTVFVVCQDSNDSEGAPISFDYGNLRYTITSAVDHEVSVIGPITGTVSGTLTIPSSVTYNSVSYNVTSIGNNAFSFCIGLTSLTIPNTVTSIGEFVVYGCEGLTSITIPSSVTTLAMIFPSFFTLTFYAEDGITVLSPTVENLCGYTFEGTYRSMVRQSNSPPPSPVSSTYTVSFPSGYGYTVSYTSDTVSSGGSVTFSVSVSEGYILNPVTATNGTLSHYSSGYMLSDITADSYVNITAYSQSSIPGEADNSTDDSSYAAVGVAVVAAMICLIAALMVFFKMD